MLLNDDVKIEVRETFKDLKDKIKLIAFTQKIECHYCEENRKLAQVISELSDRIQLEIYDFQQDKEMAEKYGIDKIPALVVMGEDRDDHIRFFGMPGGYEFTSLIEAVRTVSGSQSALSEETRKYLDGLDTDIHLQVFVTPTCPYCPPAVILAHQMAQYSDHVRADMVESIEFPHLANRYNIQGVPRTVINETEYLEGAAPEAALIEKIKKALE